MESALWPAPFFMERAGKSAGEENSSQGRGRCPNARGVGIISTLSQQRGKPGVATRARIEFRLGLTKKAKALAVFPAVLGLYLLFMGFSYFRSFHPSDPARYLFGLPPVALSLSLFGLMFYYPRKMCQGVVSVTPTGVEYDPGRHDLNLHFPWGDMLYSAPKNPQQMIRSLLICHRDKKLLLYDFQVPQFDLLLAEVTKRKGKSNAAAKDGGLKIDSGRIGDIDPRMTGR